VLVPVDVRVTGPNGSPVTNLTAKDFTIFEDGVGQQVSQCATRSVSARTPPSSESSAPASRSFFIVLGRGRLNVPAKALDATIRFVSDGLTANDRVGLLAYLHVVELTTDHAAIARLLERYRDRHEDVEARISRDASRAIGAPSWSLAADTIKSIEELIAAPGLPIAQRFPGGAGGQASQFHDLTYTLLALEYLRHIEGEKQLVLLTNRGIPVSDGLNWFVNKAAAARVAISVVQTGGIVGPPPAMALTPMAESFSRTQIAFASDGRTLAEQTGGQASFFQDPGRSFGELAERTSVQYLLGYYPLRPPRDGEYRDVRVMVSRPGLTLSYRHRYQAQPPVKGAIDLRRIFAEARILQATSTGRAPANIPMKVAARSALGEHDDVQVDVTVAVDPRWVTFTRSGGRVLTFLDVAAFAEDAKGEPVGESWGRIDLVLSPEEHARLLRERISYRTAITVNKPAGRVKVVLYEYEANRVAHAVVPVK
jgi:VWFA-related protein